MASPTPNQHMARLLFNLRLRGYSGHAIQKLAEIDPYSVGYASVSAVFITERGPVVHVVTHESRGDAMVFSHTDGRLHTR